MVLPFLLSTRPPRRKSTPGRSIPSSPAAKVIVLSAGNACTTNRVGRLKRFLLLSLIHISEPTRRTPTSYAVFCLKKKIQHRTGDSDPAVRIWIHYFFFF